MPELSIATPVPCCGAQQNLMRKLPLALVLKAYGAINKVAYLVTAMSCGHLMHPLCLHQVDIV